MKNPYSPTEKNLSLRNVDRAIADLRRALCVIVQAPDSAVLALSTEMAFEDAKLRMESLAQTSAILALTAHRANVLHILPTGDETIQVEIADWMKTDLLRALADATHDLDQPFRGPFNRIKSSTPKTVTAAIKMAKLGRSCHPYYSVKLIQRMLKA